VLEVEIEHALEQARPAHARRARVLNTRRRSGIASRLRNGRVPEVSIRGGATAMIGQRSGGQKQLFYSFNLDDRVPAEYLLRRLVGLEILSV
jgi:hypothetical protein